ncbi:LD-carboxypeptidase [Aquimarina sp. U1-2]|uniref:S66 peptidase family protein n=1 Tax=Aquimarina sp. U1-2 TaxID=2823141 RepID=UPI001AECCAA8|nr:LD-carboxypeptidase [Aquimarina sp. U1-2]MBP2833168.1 LD-carboxypeptidase [Aquimarina sp. U1-2]
MFTPNFVKKGDKIAIVSTAKKVNYREIEEAIYWLKQWGLEPVKGSTIDKVHHQFAGSDSERVEDFQRMLDSNDIKAIWCARGGYGTIRILDGIDFSVFKKQPKWIIGYSDITVLHSHIHNFKIKTIHAAMPFDFYKGTQASINSLEEVLFGQLGAYTIASSKKNKTGKGSGQLIGGNLSILYSLCGSPSALDTAGKILCIEDLDEYLYHIDRMLYNLKRNGYFDQLSGLIVGGMTKMHDNIIPFGRNVKEIILDIVQEYDFPVAFNFPMGHIEDNRALILGSKIALEVSKESVKFEYI